MSPQKRKASDKKTKSLFGLKLMVNLLWRKKQLRLWTLVSGCFSTNFCGLGLIIPLSCRTANAGNSPDPLTPKSCELGDRAKKSEVSFSLWPGFLLFSG